MIAIHSNKGLYKRKYDHPNFEERWIKYCNENGIEYKIVNAYDTDIVKQLDDCSAFMWNFTQNKIEDQLFAKQLLFSLNAKGMKTFPVVEDSWHFDDKLGQKYLLESLNVPFVRTNAFYSKEVALQWLENETFPKVGKLRGGAGSAQVFLLKNKSQAVRIIKKAFGKGISMHNRFSVFKEKMRLFKIGRGYINILKAIYFLIFQSEYSKIHGREKGYVYFQDFIPNNDFDIRIVVVDSKAYAIKRFVRENDFRASGSGNITYKREDFDERCVKIAFDVSKKLKSKSLNYDFIFDENNNPLIVELSYTNKASGYDKCEGYWDEDLNWNEGCFNPYGWMVEMVK